MTGGVTETQSTQATTTPSDNAYLAADAGSLAVQRGASNPALSNEASAAQTHIAGLEVPAYTGNLPSPLQVMWYAPQGLADAFYVPDSEIRGWVDDAAHYHGVPTELFAAVLQNENDPNASFGRQVLQFGERSLTTFADILDRTFFDLVPDFASGGSSGIANMSRNALLGAADYVEDELGRKVIPDEVAQRAFGWRQDSRISGDDLRADLYYASAHLRELIDQATGVKNYSGPLSMEQVQDIAAAYNGSGPAADRYGDAAVRHLEAASASETPLYFYQPR